MNIKDFKGYDEFKKHCNFELCTKRYPDWVGSEKYIVITDDAEKDLLETFPEIMKALSPYVIIGRYFSKMNDDMHYNDTKSVASSFSLDQVDDNESMVDELASPDFAEEICLSITIDTALRSLNPSQRSRIIRRYYRGMTIVDIAKQDGVSPQAVRTSIERALETAKKNF